VQTGLVHVLLKERLLGCASTLRADMWGADLVEALMRCCTAAVGEEHGRRALCARLHNRGGKQEPTVELI